MLTDDQYVDIGETEWVQKDGTPILYREMAISHLRNAIAMRQRQIRQVDLWVYNRRLRKDDREYHNLVSGAAERSIVVAIMTAYADERVRRNHILQAPSSKWRGYKLEKSHAHAP